MKAHPLPPLSLEAVTALRGKATILHPTTFTVEVGERIAILGPNGAGKSTLLKRIAGLLGGGGAVLLMGEEAQSLSRIERAKRLAYLPQESPIAWGITVEQLVSLGRLPHGVDLDALSPADQAAIFAAMAALDVTAWRHRAVNTLSTGERARVLVARAIAGQAPIMLADEPVSALDPRHQIGVLQALSDYAAQGRAVVAVMHDLTLAAQWASRILLLDAGHVIYDGSPETALTPENLDPLFKISTKMISQAGESAITFRVD